MGRFSLCQPPDTIPLLDTVQLRNITMDDEELMHEIVSALIDDTSRHLDLLREAVERADSEECVRLAHYAKGACVNVGAASMAAILLSLERNAAQGHLSACAECIRYLSAELQRFRSGAASI